jgi:hypothetical protein
VLLALRLLVGFLPGGSIGAAAIALLIMSGGDRQANRSDAGAVNSAPLPVIKIVAVALVHAEQRHPISSVIADWWWHD